jgi:hypothetical protein
MEKIKKLLKNKTFLMIAGAILFVVILIGSMVKTNIEQQKAEQAAQERREAREKIKSKDKDEYNDNMILKMQADLIDSYGKLPDGYLWDTDGTLLSLGDKEMSAEEVVYAYLNGLRALDMSMVQKYSRRSKVIDTYEGYFDEKKKNTDYTDQFLRNMYREALLSIEVDGIVNSSVFAENKQVFTVRVKMLDLTSKDFWEDDKEEIYKNLKIYGSDESDSTKLDMYLYDYILDYYQSEDAVKRSVTFDLTVQRYPDLDTGWLVSVDTDVDLACRYADGKLVVSYITERYMDEGKELLESIKNAEEVD